MIPIKPALLNVCRISLIVLIAFNASSGLFAQRDTNIIIREVQGFQQYLNSEYRNASTSPLPKEARKNFKGHLFFPIDMHYVVKSKLAITPGDKKIKMAASNGTEKEFYEYGTVAFTLFDKNYKLLVYKPVNRTDLKDYLFIPFRDATSGNETYGGGRYLDLIIPKKDSLLLNFNKAYNPYCAYVSGYACPVPPAENFLPVKIEAGVKLK